jgi:hypothetical protein
MAHEDAGKYAAKHPADTARSEQIVKAIQEKSPGGALSCAIGEKISKDLKVEMAQVGITADLLEMKIKECQLGLFGWGDKPGHGKDIRSIDPVPVELKSAIEKAVVNGNVACAAAWRIADELKLKRRVVSAACEALKLKIRPCQLGAF